MPLETVFEPGYGSVVRQLGRALDQLQKGFFSFCPVETWAPAVNLYETEAAYYVCVDLSGVQKEKIDLVVADGQLRLRGQRPVPVVPPAGEDLPRPGNERVRIHLMEIDYGPFCREVALPADADQDRIVASYRDGMLWVELPKK